MKQHLWKIYNIHWRLVGKVRTYGELVSNFGESLQGWSIGTSTKLDLHPRSVNSQGKWRPTTLHCGKDKDHWRKKGKPIPSFAMQIKRWKNKEKMDIEHSWLERTKHWKDSIPTIFSKQIFKEMKLCGLSPNSYIHVSVSDFYIPRIGLPILLQENKRTGRMWCMGIYKSLTGIHECGNWDSGRAGSFLGVYKSDFLCSEEATVEKRSGSRNNGWKQDGMKEDEEQRWGGGIAL